MCSSILRAIHIAMQFTRQYSASTSYGLGGCTLRTPISLFLQTQLMIIIDNNISILVSVNIVTLNASTSILLLHVRLTLGTQMNDAQQCFDSNIKLDIVDDEPKF